MGEFEDKVNRILSDPGQMEKIAGLARSLMGGENGENRLDTDSPDPAPESMLPELNPAMLGKLSAMLRGGGGPDRERQALLEAMKPYLSEKRRSKMEKAMKIAGLARIARLAMGEMGDGDV